MIRIELPIPMAAAQASARVSRDVPTAGRCGEPVPVAAVVAELNVSARPRCRRVRNSHLE